MTRRLTITRELIGELTVAELELLEERTGRPLSRLFDQDAPRGALLRTLAFVQLRREDPDATWEDAGAVIVTLADAPEVAGSTADPSAGGRGRRRG